MAEPNTRVQAPFGDIFFPTSSYGDQLTNRLYVEQKQREAERKRQAEQLDAEFAKNVSAMRDADVDDVVSAYGEWKAATQQAMKKKGGISPQEQLALLKKKGDINRIIELSKRGYAEEEDLRKDIQKNPLEYDDNAATYLSQRRKMRMGDISNYKDEKGSPLDLGDLKTYMYKGTNTDFQKILQSAQGTPRQVFQKEEELPGGLQFKITPYMYGNTPGQFKESVLGSLAQRKAGVDAERIISQVPPEEIAATDKAFKSIPPETWKQMGVEKPQELMVDRAMSAAEKYATYQAQLYALNNLPKEGAPIFRDNKKAIDDQNFKQQKQLKDYEHKLKQMDEQQKNTWLKDFIIDQSEKARRDQFGNLKPMATYETGAGRIAGNEIPLSSFLNKAFKKGEYEPAKIIVSDVQVQQPDGSFKLDRKYTPLYYKDDDKGNKVLIKELSQPQDIDMTVVDMGGQVGVKQKNIEGAALVGKQPEKTTKTTTSSSSKYYIKGKDYSESDLLKMGYTLDQIKKYKK